MKKAIHSSIILIVGLFIFLPSSYPSDFETRLGEIYSTIIPGEIRRNFDQYIKQYQDCPECNRATIEGNDFIDIYGKKFMVINLENNNFGGVWAIIATKDSRQQFFKLWIYDIEDDAYELRSISRLDDIEDKDFIDKIFDITYNDFWL